MAIPGCGGTASVGGRAVGTVAAWSVSAAPADPTEAAFWRAVGDRPDDQLPRLVFADFLEERGRADEAAALRATSSRVPYPLKKRTSDVYWWFIGGSGRSMNQVPNDVASALSAVQNGPFFDYPSAEAAIRDLVRAWLVVNRADQLTGV